MAYLRRVTGRTRPGIVKRKYICRESGTESIVDEITSNKTRWKKRIERIPDGRIPKDTKHLARMGMN